MSAPAGASAPAAVERWEGLGLVLLAALTWSLAGIGIKLVDAHAMAIAGYRGLFAIPVLALPALLGARGGERPAGDLLREALRDRTVWAGAACYAVTVVCFVLANRLTTAANAILLQYTAPIYVALLSWPLLREPVRPIDWLAIAGCVLGMAWFFTDRLSASGWIGNGIAVASGVGFGLLPIMLRLSQRRAQQHGPADPALLRLLPLLTIVLGNVLAALCGLPWMISGAPRSPTGWVVLALLGLVQIGLAYLFFALGVRRVKAVQCMLVCTVEPILNPVWVALGTGERPSRPALVGGALILLSVTAHGLISGLRPARPAPSPGPATPAPAPATAAAVPATPAPAGPPAPP